MEITGEAKGLNGDGSGVKGIGVEEERERGGQVARKEGKCG